MKKPVTKAEKALAFGKAGKHCEAIEDLLVSLDEFTDVVSSALNDIMMIIDSGINEIGPLERNSISSTKGEILSRCVKGDFGAFKELS